MLGSICLADLEDVDGWADRASKEPNDDGAGGLG
jgi:hypothetical protein